MNIIAVDIGTSRIKAAVFTACGRMLAMVDHHLPRMARPTTQSALEWAESSEALLRQLAAKHSIDGVVLTGNMHALLPIGEDDEPLAPAILWNDSAAQAETEELNEKYGQELLHQFGNQATPVFTFPKMMRCQRTQPEIYAKTKVFLQSKDYVAVRLTDKWGTDWVDASGVLGMNLQTKAWEREFFTEAGLDHQKMPPIYGSSEVIGKVTAAAAARTGLRVGIPVVIGAGDLATAAIGSGVGPSTMSLTLGTAGQLLATGNVEAGRLLAGQLFVFAHADPEQLLFLGSVPAGGFNFEWIASLFGLSMAAFFQAAATAIASPDLPLYLPYLLGRGAPYMDYFPDGSWRGLQAHHRQEDLCAAAVWGTLSALRQSADLLEQLVGARPQLVLQALACRESVVRQAAAGLFSDKQLLLPENAEASLVGAAALGLVGLGIKADLSQAVATLFQAEALAIEEGNIATIAASQYQRYRQEIDDNAYKVPQAKEIHQDK